LRKDKFFREIEFYLKFETQKINLLNCSDFTPDIGFNEIINKNDDHINFRNLQEFFIKNDFKVENINILLIMRRIDLEKEGKISRDCFKFALTPKLSLYEKKNSILKESCENFRAIKDNKNSSLKNSSNIQDLIKIIGYCFLS
jgi:hypothetical protein